MPKIYVPRKYEPLRAYLAAQPGRQVMLTLWELEAILDAPLPRSAQSRGWWTRATAGPQTSAWREAGWRVARVAPRPAPGIVTFVRDDEPARADAARPPTMAIADRRER